MTRKQIRRAYWLNTVREIPKTTNLRQFFAAWSARRKFRPDHFPPGLGWHPELK